MGLILLEKIRDKNERYWNVQDFGVKECIVSGIDNKNKELTANSRLTWEHLEVVEDNIDFAIISLLRWLKPEDVTIDVTFPLLRF